MTVKTPSIALDQTESTLAIGETVALKATVKPASAGTVTYTTSDEKVATVANGTVTAVAAGEATITASAKCGSKTVTATAKITVKKYAFKSVKQTKLAELEAEIVGDTKGLKPADFTLVNTETKVVRPVTKVSVDSKDTTKVTLALTGNLDDGKNYELTLDGVTKSFKASDGKVASLAVEPITIPYATAKPIKLVSKDSMGVIIDEKKYGEQDTSKYDFKITLNNGGSISGSDLTLNKVGDTATAEVSYKSGKYDATGKPEGNVGPEKFTITAVDQAAVSSIDVRIDNNTKTAFDKAKDNKRIAAEDKNQAAYFCIKDTDGTEISATEYAKYSVKSSDPNVLVLASGTLGKSGIGLTAYKSGTAYLLIEKDSKLVGSIAIDVVEKRAASTMTVDNTSLTMTNRFAQTKKVKVTIKDQYGDDCADSFYTPDGGLTVTADSANPTAAAPDTALGTPSVAKELSFVTATTTKPGTYKYTVTYKKDKVELSQTITVNVETTAADATSYALDLDKTNVEIAVKEDGTIDEQQIKMNLLGKAADGKITGKISNVNYIIKKPDGSTFYDSINGVSGVKTNAAVQVDANVETVQGTELILDVVKITGSAPDENVTVYLWDKGTYTVIARYTDGNSKLHETQASFTIDNKLPEVTVSQKDAKGATSVTDAIQKSLTVSYDGKDYTGSDLAISGTPKVSLNATGETTGDVIGTNDTTMKIVDLSVTVKVGGTGDTKKYTMVIKLDASKLNVINIK